MDIDHVQVRCYQERNVRSVACVTFIVLIILIALWNCMVQNERLSQIQLLFEQSDENMKVGTSLSSAQVIISLLHGFIYMQRRDVPDYFVDKVSFNIMHGKHLQRENSLPFKLPV